MGATGINDRRAYFSNYGDCVDVFAPGVSIPSAAINGQEFVVLKSGTSMACPHVSGIESFANKTILNQKLLWASFRHCQRCKDMGKVIGLQLSWISG